MRASREAHPNRVLYMLAKQRAKKKGIRFSIKSSDIVVPEKCPVLGVRLKRGKDKRPLPTSPTLDRIVPSRGYVPGNVVVISSLANRIKSTANWEQVIAVGTWLKNLTRQRRRR
jgi:hypothetical protein